MSWTEQSPTTNTWIEHNENSSWGFINFTYGDNSNGETQYSHPYDNTIDYNADGAVNVNDAIHYTNNAIHTSHIPDNRTWGNAYDGSVPHYQESIVWTNQLGETIWDSAYDNTVDYNEDGSVNVLDATRYAIFQWTESSQDYSSSFTESAPTTTTWTEEN